MDSILEDLLFDTLGTRAREIETPEMPMEARTPAAKTGLASPATFTSLIEQGVSPEDMHLEHELIALLAYSYWEAWGRPEGSAEEDWFRAERELRSQQA